MVQSPNQTNLSRAVDNACIMLALLVTLGGMLVNITIRHVPPHIRDELARRAKLRGQSTQEFLWELLARVTGRPDKAELLRQLDDDLAGMNPIDVDSLIVRSDDGRY